MGNRCANLPVDESSRKRIVVSQRTLKALQDNQDVQTNTRSTKHKKAQRRNSVNRFEANTPPVNSPIEQSNNNDALNSAIERFLSKDSKELSSKALVSLAQELSRRRGDHPIQALSILRRGMDFSRFDLSKASIASTLLNAQQNRIVEESENVNDTKFSEWDEKSEELNTESLNFYISKHDTHFGLQLTSDPQLNCSFVSILCYQQRLKRMLLTPSRILRRSTNGFESKLFFNGCWRSVKSTARKFVWSVIIEAIVRILYHDKQQEEYLFRILALLPERIEARHIRDSKPLFDLLKDEFDRGRVLIGLTINNVSCTTVLAMSIVDEKRYVAVRLGVYCELIQELMPSEMPSSLTQYFVPELSMFVLEWTALQRQYCTFELSWLTEGNHLRVVHGEYKAPTEQQARNSNFNDQHFSFYSCPQHVITIPSHPEPLQIKIIVERHTKNTSTEQSVNALLYRSAERIVYPRESLCPISYSSYGELVSCSFFLPPQQERQKYCVVLATPSIVDESYYYTLSVVSKHELELVKLASPTHLPIRFEGTYSNANYGQSLYSPKLLNSPMYKITAECPLQLEIRLETKDKRARLLLVLYRIHDDDLDFRQILSNRYCHFLQNFKSPGASYCGLSYFPTNIECGTYLLIPLLLSPPSIPTRYVLELNCLPASSQTRLTVASFPTLQFEHKSQITGCWLQPTEVPLNGHFFANTRLIDSGCIGVFKLQGEIDISCWLRCESNSRSRLSNEANAIPIIALVIVELGLAAGKLTGRRVYSTDWTATSIGLHTRVLHLRGLPARYCGVICLSKRQDPFRLTVFSSRRINLQRAATAMPLD